MGILSPHATLNLSYRFRFPVAYENKTKKMQVQHKKELSTMKKFKKVARLIKKSIKFQDQAIKSNPALYRQIALQDDFLGGF